MKTILLSSGHSLTDPGAVSGAFKESQITMQLVTLASEMLRKHGIGVLNVPDGLNLVSTIVYVNERAEQIDAAIEVHINSGGGRGTEAWYYHNFSTGKGDEQSMRLSQSLVDAIQAESGMPTRGIKDESTNKHGKLGFVHDTKPIAALVECGFIDTPADTAVIGTSEGREKVARGLTRGILTYLGEAWRPELLQSGTSDSNPVPTPPQNEEVTQLKDRIQQLESEMDSKLALKDKECYTRLQAYKDKLIKLLQDTPVKE